MIYSSTDGLRDIATKGASHLINGPTNSTAQPSPLQPGTPSFRSVLLRCRCINSSSTFTLTCIYHAMPPSYALALPLLAFSRATRLPVRVKIVYSSWTMSPVVGAQSGIR